MQPFIWQLQFQQQNGETFFINICWTRQLYYVQMKWRYTDKVTRRPVNTSDGRRSLDEAYRSKARLNVKEEHRPISTLSNSQIYINLTQLINTGPSPPYQIIRYK